MSEVITRVKLVKAVYNFQPTKTDELAFQKGDVITITQQIDGGWWEGTLNGITGWFPSNYVRDVKGGEAARAGAKSPTPKPVETKGSGGAQRESSINHNVVLQSLTSTEKSFVNELEDLLRIYLRPLELNGLLSATEYVEIIGNLPDITSLHHTLLNALEESAQQPVNQQRIGGVLLQMAPQIQSLYNRYCTNHPRAANLLQTKRDELSQYMEALGAPSPGVMTLTTGLSKPFRRLDRYSGLLKELERHTDEAHADRGDTQRAIVVYRDIANTEFRMQLTLLGTCPLQLLADRLWLITLSAVGTAAPNGCDEVMTPQLAAVPNVVILPELSCSEIRKQKEMEYEIRRSEIRDWEGEELSQLGEILLLSHAAVQLESGDPRERILLLFPALLVMLSVTPRVSGYGYEGRMSLNGTTVNTVEESDGFNSFAFEITGGSNVAERITIACTSLHDKNKWLSALRPYVRLGPSCVSPKPHAMQTTPSRSLMSPKIIAPKPITPSPAPSINSSTYRATPLQSTKWNLSCLRPGPPLRPSVSLKDDGTRSPRATRRLIGSTRRKPVDDAKILEEDAVMLQIIEAYCTSTKARQTVNSLDLAKIRLTQTELRKDLWDALLENPQVLIAEEEKMIVEEIKDNQTVVEEKTLVDTVYSLKDQVKELRQEQTRLRKDLENEKRARKRLELMLRQSLTSIVENTFENQDSLMNNTNT